MFELVAFAEGEAAATASAGGAVGLIGTFLPFVVVILLLYFMMIRPQRKRDKEAKAMIEALKVGDKIVTIGGICGKITKIKDEYIFLETGSVGNPAEQSVIKMERASIRDVEKKQEA